MGKRLPNDFISAPDKTLSGRPEKTPTTVHDIRLQNALIQKLRHVEPIPGMHLRFPGAQSLADSRKRLARWLELVALRVDRDAWRRDALDARAELAAIGRLAKSWSSAA